VAATSRHRRTKKIFRTGRHTTPSQAEQIAQQARKAVPAVAVVGALAAAPQAHAASPARPVAVTARLAAAQHAHTAKPAAVAARVGPGRSGVATLTARELARSYTVQPGDTLAGIAERYFGAASAWHSLYRANSTLISDPNLILPGQVLSVPASPAATTRGARQAGGGNQEGGGNQGGGDGYAPRHARHHDARHHDARHHEEPTSRHGGPQGTLSCGGLEQLWMSAGGPSGAAVTAASVAMAESAGQQYATGPYGERGYWQINPVNGAVLSTYDAYGNARAAVVMSHGGTDWSAWTTYTSGAYQGRC
jgi:LysM repeat protein